MNPVECRPVRWRRTEETSPDQDMDVQVEEDYCTETVDRRLRALEASLLPRIERLEEALAELLTHNAAQIGTLKRAVEMRTARTGELSSRIAQRLARVETAIELLSRDDHGESTDQA